MNAYALPGLDHWLSAPYDDIEPEIEPTLDDVQEALDRLVQDHELLREYVTDVCVDPTTLLQLVYVGQPRPDDKSERADARRDAYSAAKDEFFAGYRDWLRDIDELDAVAKTVAQERIDAERAENRCVR